MKPSVLCKERKAKKKWENETKGGLLALTFPLTTGAVVKNNKRMVPERHKHTYIEMLTGKQLGARMDYSFIASSLSLFRDVQKRNTALYSIYCICSPLHNSSDDYATKQQAGGEETMWNRFKDEHFCVLLGKHVSRLWPLVHMCVSVVRKLARSLSELCFCTGNMCAAVAFVLLQGLKTKSITSFPGKTEQWRERWGEQSREELDR